MPKRFRVYAALLRLYPKMYYREYGQQMEQTLADMLDDAETSLGKAQIWAQVALDLPVTIVQQNLIATKGISMQKHVPHISKKVVITGLAILLVAGGLGAYQYGRSRVIPAVVKVVYGKDMRGTYERELAAIGDPINTLLQVDKKGETRCNAIMYQGVKTLVDCSVSAQRYGLVAQGAAGKSRTLAAAKEVEAGLKRSGYEGGSNGVTVASLVGGTYEGKDYSPDAYYQKRMGKYTCIFQTTVAYSNPKPAAINVWFGCYRTFKVFGDPVLSQSVQGEFPKG